MPMGAGVTVSAVESVQSRVAPSHSHSAMHTALRSASRPRLSGPTRHRTLGASVSVYVHTFAHGTVSVSVETRCSDDLYPGSSPDGDEVGAER